jgi:Phycobilisome degradation protein nblA
MDKLILELSLEQKFSLARYQEQVRSLSHGQAQEFLIELLRQTMVKDNVIRSLLRSGIR